jgi:hypothetical protein
LDSPENGGYFRDSPVFDPIIGHGGDGIEVQRSKRHFTNQSHSEKGSPSDHDDDEGGCIQDGPFKNLTIRIGPFGRMVPDNNRCLRRKFNVRLAHEVAGKRSMTAVLNSKDFTQFRMMIERGHEVHIGEELKDSQSKNDHDIIIDGDLHNIGHTGIGGEVSCRLFRYQHRTTNSSNR